MLVVFKSCRLKGASIQKADIIREFDKEAFDKKDVIKTPGDFDINNGLPIQGHNSTYLKFSKNICKKCNNEKSQPFDLSYDKFMTYIKNNEELIFESKKVNLPSAFGENWETQYNNFIKYLVKNICTRFADSGVKIEQEIIDFLNGKGELKFLELVLQIRTDWVEFYKHLKSKNEDYGYVHASGIEGQQSKSLGTYYYLGGILQYRWFQITYRYDKKNLDLSIIKKCPKTLILIEVYNITPQEMKEMIRKNGR